jgi:hypothetical protein
MKRKRGNYKSLKNENKSRDSLVDIVTVYRLDDRALGVRVLVEARIFPSPCRPDWL